MWLLQHEGGFFDKKKIWLRPGKSYLFGRTGNIAGQRLFQITSKSVSRQHLVMSIGPVDGGDVGRIETKSKIVLRDESKFGTIISERRIKNEAAVLDGRDHRIQLGNWTEGFLLTWHPICLTLSHSEKSNHKDHALFQRSRDQFEQLDIKIIAPYVTNSTTHVVSAKRNVPKGLQALVNASYVVTEDFMMAILNSTRSPGLEDDGQTALLSPLEQDFDQHWPNELHYLPSEGKEPNPRPAHFFAPNPTRISIFEGFTFVFGDVSQSESLQQALLSGGAKCSTFPVVPLQTTVQEFASFIQDAASVRGLTCLTDRDGKGVVVVRFRTKNEETARWTQEFQDECDRLLGQHSIQQNEFLDAILTNDTSILKRPLQRLDLQSATQSTSQRPDQELAGDSGVHSNATAIKKRFKGWDDDEDNEDGEDHSDVHDRNGAEQGQGTYQALPVENTGLEFTTTALAEKSPRKRMAPYDILNARGDAMFPGAAAMKRRRFALRAPGETSLSIATQSTGRSEQPRTHHGVDVKTVAKTFARDIDEQSAREREEDEEVDMERIAQLRDLAIIEGMEISASRARASASTPTPAKWRGRPNYKRFKRYDDSGAAARRGHRTIVGLEEVHSMSLNVDDDSSGFGSSAFNRDPRDFHDRGTFRTRLAGPDSNLHTNDDATDRVDEDDQASATQSQQFAHPSRGHDLGHIVPSKRSASLEEPKDPQSPSTSKSKRWKPQRLQEDSSSDDADELGIRFRRRRDRH